MSWKSFEGLKDGISKGVGKISNMTEKFINENLKVDDEEADQFFKELEQSVAKKKGPLSFDINPKPMAKPIKKTATESNPQNPQNSDSPIKIDQKNQTAGNNLSSSADLKLGSGDLMPAISGFAEPLDLDYSQNDKNESNLTKSVEITRTSADLNLSPNLDEPELKKKAVPHVSNSSEDETIKNQIKELEANLKKKSDEAMHLQNELKRVSHEKEARIQQLEADKKELETNNHALKDQRNNAEKTVDVLQEEIDTMRDKITSLEKSLSEQTIKFNHLNTEHIRMIELNKAELSEVLEKPTKILAEINSELENAGLKTEQLEAILSKVFHGTEIKIQPEESTQKLNQETINLKIENQELKSKIEELERIKEDLTKSLQIEHEKANLDKQALMSIKDQVQELNIQLHEAREVIQAKDSQIKQLESLSHPDQALMSKLNDVSQQNFQYQEHINQLDEKLRNLTKDSKVIITERDNLKQQIAGLEQKKVSDELTVSNEVKQIVFSKIQKLTTLQKGLDLEKLGESKIAYQKDNRITIPVFSQALEDTLKIFIEVFSKRINSEQEEFNEKEKTESLNKALNKAKNEATDLNKKLQDTLSEKIEYKKKAEDFKEKFEDMTNTANQYLAKMKELQKNLSDSNEMKTKLQEDLKEKNKLIEQQKEKYKEFQEASSTNEEQLSTLEEKLSLIPELQGELEKKMLEIAELKEILESKISENEALNMSINNIQTVLDENQQIHDNISLQYDAQIKKLRNELEQAHRKNEQVEEYKQKCEQMEKENFTMHNQVREITHKLRESDQEKLIIQNETEALVKKMKAQALYQENLVDKRVIINCLIKYLDMNSTYPVKMGTLDTLSSLLTCTEEERAKLGLKYYVPEGKILPKSEERTLQTKTSQEDVSSPKKQDPEKIEKKAESLDSTPTTPGKIDDKANTPSKTDEKPNTSSNGLGNLFMSFLLDKD